MHTRKEYTVQYSDLYFYEKIGLVCAHYRDPHMDLVEQGKCFSRTREQRPNVLEGAEKQYRIGEQGTYDFFTFRGTREQVYLLQGNKENRYQQGGPHC